MEINCIDKCCAIFLNGSLTIEDIKVKDLKGYAHLICVDGAGNFMAENNMLPDFLIGDFDSIKKKNLDFFLDNKVKVEKHPTEKDFTDSQLAINKAVELGYKKADIYGAFGNRIDHTLGNIGLIHYGYKLGIEISLIDKNSTLSLLKEGTCSIYPEIDRVFSILPIFEDLSSLSIIGAKYELNNEILKQCEPRGISNEFLDQMVTIINKKGIGVLCISNKI